MAASITSVLVFIAMARAQSQTYLILGPSINTCTEGYLMSEEDCAIAGASGFNDIDRFTVANSHDNFPPGCIQCVTYCDFVMFHLV